jgi:hypothetical protein
MLKMVVKDQCAVTDSCERGNEPSGPIKNWEIVD